MKLSRIQKLFFFCTPTLPLAIAVNIAGPNGTLHSTLLRDVQC